MRQRKNGATRAEIRDQMGWQKYTVGGFMAERSYRGQPVTSPLLLARPAPVAAGSFLFTLDSDEPVCNSAALAVVAPPLAHTWPTLRPGTRRRQVLPGRGVSARGRLLVTVIWAKHWGETGGTLGGKDKA